MNSKQYADQHFKGFPTWHKIAKQAFEAGQEQAKPAETKQLESKIKELKQKLKDKQKELDSLWGTLEDPEKCGELLSGM